MKSKMKRLSKSTVSVLLALIMVVSMIAVGLATVFAATDGYVKAGKVYFVKPSSWSNVSILEQQKDKTWSIADAFTLIQDDLYYYDASTMIDYMKNGDNPGIDYCFIDANWGDDSGEGRAANDRRTSAAHYTAMLSYKFSTGSTYYLNQPNDSPSNDIAVSQNYYTNQNSLKLNQRAYAYYKAPGSASFSNGTTGGTVTVGGYYFSGDSTVTSGSTTTGSDKNYDCAVGTTATLTANPTVGYQFVGWFSSANGSGNAVSNDTTFTYIVRQANTYYARFEKTEDMFDVSVNAGTGGSVSPSSVNVGEYTGATITATPNKGYVFDEWTTDDAEHITIESPSNTTTDVHATAAGTITATFTEKAKQTVTITAPTNGSVTVSGSSVSGSETVNVASGGSTRIFQAHVDDVLTITATPANGTDSYGYKLKSLTVADQAITSNSTYTVVAGTDPTVTATFVQTDTYRIKVFAGSGGETKMTIDDGDEVTISPNQAQNFDVPWAKGYTVSWASGSGNEFNGVTKNGAAISGATDNSNATGTRADDGAVYKTSFTASWPPVSGFSKSSTTTAYIWVATDQKLEQNQYQYYCASSSDDYTVLKNGNKNWISLSADNLAKVKKSNSNFYVGFATTSNYNDIATSATVNIASGYNFAINDSGVQGQNFGDDGDEEKIARYHTNSTDYNDITHIGILVDNTNSSKPTYTIYSSGNSTTGDVNFDPFYLGGRFTINNGSADVSAGNDKWNFSMNSTNIKWTKDAATGYYKLATNKKISDLSPMKNDDGTGGFTDQLLLVHDTVNKYSIYNGAYSGHNFQDNLGEANALTLTNTETNPLSQNELMFDDPDNTSNGKVIIWIDADNYAEGNANSRLKIWYTLENETPAVAEKLNFSISPASVMVGSSATLTATATGVNNPSDVKFVFEKKDGNDWVAVDTVNGSDATRVSDGVYRAQKSVTNNTAASYTYRVTVKPANDAESPRSVSKQAVGTWKPQTVYYTDDITDDASAPTWYDVDPATKFAKITGVSLDEGEEYTFALSDTEAYNPDFADFEIATEYNQFCDITMSHKTVTIDGEDRVVRTYVVTPRTNCFDPDIYINADTKQVYAVATYGGDTSTKTSAETKTVTYYFAERVANSSGTAVDDYKKSNPSANNNSGMKIKYWNNSTGASAEANVTTAVNVNNSNIIYVSTADLFRQNPTTLGAKSTSTTGSGNTYNQFRVYSVELPIWATSFRFLTSSSAQFNAVPTYTADDYNVNHSITLNPNRIYLLYQNKTTVDISRDEDWTVKGVILDESMWSNTRKAVGNEVPTKGFTANLIDYKNISGLENQNNGINSRLQTLYNSSNYNTPNALYFGYISSKQSWTGMSTDQQWAQSNAQRKNDNSYYASIQNMVGATLTTNGKSVGSKGTYDSEDLNANGFGLMLDTRNDSTNGIKNSNLMPLFDYTALAADSNAARVVKQGLSFPFYESIYNGITTFSYDSTTDRNRVYDSTTENFKIQTDNDNESYGVTGMSTGKDSDNKGYAGFFPFGGNTDKYSNTGFATEFDLNFYMTNSGYLIDSNDVAQDIAFNFSGDDDVWVYVDGVKVLDLGGDHKVSAASINFSQGKVYYKSAANSIANVTGCTDAWASSGDYVKTVDLVDLMASYGVDFSATDASTKHTFQMFYMERGAFQSNCVISFNLPQASGLNVRNTVTADHVNKGLKDAALAASNTDYFTYGVGNALVGSNAPIETLKGKGGIYAKALLPTDTADWSFVKNTPLYPYFYDITRVFGGESLVLSSASGSGTSTGSDDGPALSNEFQGLKGTVYTLSDRYAQSSNDGAKLSGKTDASNGNFHLLGGEMANFADKVRPNSYVQVKQTQLLGEAAPDKDDNNIIKINTVDDNNVGNYYVTSYDIYDEAAKKNVVDKTPYDIKFGDDDVYYANDLSAAENGFYFTNYAGDSSNINPAMTVNFYNDIAVGDLIISKQVTGTNTAKDNFVFKVQFANIFGNGDENWTEYNVDYRVYNMEDDTPVTDAVQSYGSVGIVIKPGQYAKIEGIPVETRFKVTELERAGYSVVNIDKTAVKPDNSQITCKGNNEVGFYNYVQQGATTVLKDKSTDPDASGFIYYCNMIPTVAETLVSGTNYVSTSTVAYANKKENFTIQFKYYDRREIDDTTAGINSSFSSYSKPVESMDGFIKYVDNDPTQEVRSIDFAGMIADYATAFVTDTLIDNVMCDYNMWTTQQAAADAMASKKYFDNGEETSYNATQAQYHTDYLGRPSTSGEKWVNYYDSKGNPVELTSESLATEYLKVRSIVVWCYNYPKLYDVDVYGAKSSSDLDLTPKTVGGKNVYVADATKTASRSEDNNFYYNQRFGTEVANADDLNAAGFISNYGIPGVYSGNLCPQNYASDTITDGSTTYRFAYWAYDQAGTQLASTDIKYKYRVTKNTKLYAVYTTPEASGKIGLSLSANDNDTYVDSGGVSRTRLNIMANVYNAEDNDPNIKKLAFVNITLSNQIRDDIAHGTGNFTPAKINWLFNEYKEQLKAIIKLNEAHATFSGEKDGGKHTYSDADELNLTLTTKGYIYTVTSNGNPLGAGEAEMKLTNKNRGQFTIAYKTSALNVGNSNPNGATCLMYSGAVLHTGTGDEGDVWDISDNCLIYYNGAVVDNTAETWPNA